MANTMSKYGSNTNRPLSEIVGLSTDTKPTDSIEGIKIQNGSSFRELDTGKRFLFDAENTTWNEVSSGGGGSTLIEKSISANGMYNASADNADGYSKVTVDVANSYTQADEGKVVDNGALVAQTAMSSEVTENGTVDTTLYNSVTVNVPSEPNYRTSINGGVCKVYQNRYKYSDTTWSLKAWNGLTNFNGSNIWTDGNNIYCSTGSSHYILNKLTSTWVDKTFNVNFYGSYIWTDGENIYCSNSSEQYVLDKSTSTWLPKTWTGLTSFNGNAIWTDGDNIYYSNDDTQYVLDKNTSTWSTKTWNGLTVFNGFNIWTDSDDIYYSENSNQYVFDKSTSTWSVKTWNGLTNFNGNRIWTDGNNIYCSTGSSNYTLDKSTSTWSAKTWNRSDIRGDLIWTDGDDIYYSKNENNKRYVLNKSVINVPIPRP